MPFSGAGRINAVGKRGLGADIIAVAADQAEGNIAGENVFNVYQSLPGTGILNNTAGPRPYFIPNSSAGAYKTSISPSGTYLVNIGPSYPYAVIYKKVNGIWTLLNTTFYSSLVQATVYAATWTPDESKLILGTGSSPPIYVFSRSGDTFTNIAQINQPGGAGTIYSLSADPTGQYVAIGGSASPYLYIFSLSASQFVSGSNISTNPTGSVYSFSWSPNNSFLAVGGATSPYINVYSYSGSGTGTVFTKLVNPGTLPSAQINGIAFNNTSSSAITTASIALTGASGQATVYNLNLAGTATTFVNTITLSTPSTGYDITWNSDGTSLFYCGGAGSIGSQFLWGYNRSGVNTYTTITNIITTASITSFTATSASAVVWNTTTNHLILSYNALPGITEFSRSGDTFTDIDSWNRLGQGYTTRSYIATAAAETIGRWNPGGSNYAGTILATSQASALIPFYYNNNGGGQGTYTQIVTTFTATNVGTIVDMAWSPNGQLLTIYGNTSPYINAYLVTGVGTATTFTKLSSPAGLVPLPSGGNRGQIAWSPDSSILMVSGSATAPYIGWYAVTGTGISTTFTQGTYTQFSSTLTSALGGCSFSPDGTALCINNGLNGAIKIYNVSYNGTATVFSTGTTIVGTVNGIKSVWSPDGNYIASSWDGGASTQNLYVARRTGNTYTSVTPTISSLNATLSSPVWSADSSRVYCFAEGTSIMSITSYPGISMLTRSNSTSTWVYTTATVANIDIPTQSYYNIDIKYDF